MPDYKAPLRDMRFVLNEVLDLDGHYAKLGLEEVNSELLNAQGNPSTFQTQKSIINNFDLFHGDTSLIISYADVLLLVDS